MLAQTPITRPPRDDGEMKNLIQFLRGLEEIGRSYWLGFHTALDVEPRPITVHVTATAAERWEVDFFEDGTVWIERFSSEGGVEEEDAEIEVLLAELRSDS